MTRIFKKSCLPLVFVLLPAAAASAGDLRPFTTDGCSSFPDGTSEHHSLWSECCVHHDVAYWKGGTRIERRIADEALAQCVTSVGKPKTARMMLAGVRLGGTPYLPTSYRWGYGWPYPRGYKALTEEEQRLVKRQLDAQEEMLEKTLEKIRSENK